MNSSFPLGVLAITTILGMSTFYLYRSTEELASLVESHRQEGNRGLQGATTEYPFPVLQYPLHMDNVPAFVNKLMAGRYPGVTEINTNYKNIQFNPESVVSCDEDLDILILVKSVWSNREDRDAQRETWAHLRHLARFNENIKVVFLVGVPQEEPDRVALEQELEVHNDLVQGDFLDDNLDSSMKTMAGLHWAKICCQNFQFLVFIQSGVYFSLQNLLKFLRDPHFYPAKRRRSILKNNANPLPLDKLAQTDFFAGSVSPHGAEAPGRTEEDNAPILLTVEEYAQGLFPAYVRSPLLILSQTMASKFYYLSPFVAHLYQEEIYLGLMANKLKTQPVHTPFIRDLQFAPLGRNTSVLSTFKNDICLYNILPGERAKLWNHFNRLPKKPLKEQYGQESL